MILSSVIIILGEVLEFTILTSIFLALSHHLKLSRQWVIYAVIAGTTGAISYAISFDNISEWHEGFGQEVFNASLQTGIYICLLIFSNIIFVRDKYNGAIKYSVWLMTLCVCMALTREGSEIFLYLSGFISSKELIAPVLTGSTLGAGIGLSVGILIYYLFINIPYKSALYAGYFLLLFVAAGMLSQAIRLLIQIDWLPAQKIVWDTSNWLDESSVMGRLLYTLIGYEATPTLLEVQFYIAAISCILISSVISRYYAKKSLTGN